MKVTLTADKRYEGCYKCGGPIKIGERMTVERIGRMKARRWHLVCPEPKQPHPASLETWTAEDIIKREG